MKFTRIHPWLKCFICCLALLTRLGIWGLQAQDSATDKNYAGRLYGGMGLGQDYGGVGINLQFFPQKNIGVFGGVGYALAGLGYNLGLKFRLLPSQKPPRAVPFLTAMYGYNAAVAVLNQNSYSGTGNLNKLFYGPSFGVGLDLFSRKTHTNFWSFELIIPVRSPDVNHYMDSLQNYDNVQFANRPFPVTFSVGYHFGK